MRRRGLPWQKWDRGPGLLRRAWPFVILSMLVHVVAVGSLGGLMPYLGPDMKDRKPISLVILQPPAEEEPESDEEDKVQKLDGQLVEIAPPEEEEKPDEADYLAEHDATVDEETRTDQYKVNPEILSREYSREEKMQQEDLMDVNVDKPSTGAQVGNDRFDPDRDGTLASVPSPWTITNKDGLQDPVPSAHTSAARSGAPQNDFLREKRDKQVALNTNEYLYHGYLTRIRRLVNFYWEQNLDNLPRSVRLGKSQYTTAVDFVLDADGALEMIEVTQESGSEPLDDCVVRAFRLAGPFPNPPEGLIEKDGRVYLDMGFVVNVGTARANYGGIDPRAGVQFPGILKSPR